MFSIYLSIVIVVLNSNFLLIFPAVSLKIKKTYLLSFCHMFCEVGCEQ